MYGPTEKTTPAYQSLVGKPSFLSTESYGLLLLLISALFYSCMAAFVKLAANTGVPPIEQLFFRGIFQGTFVVTAMFYFEEETMSATLPTAATTDNRDTILLIQQPFGVPKVRKIVILRGLIGGLGFSCFYYTMAALPLGDATALLSMSPIITVVGSTIFLGEALYSSILLAAAASVCGALLIAKPSFLIGQDEIPSDDAANHTHQASLGHLTGLLGSFFSACVVMLVRKAGKTGVHALQLMFSWCFFGILFSSIISTTNAKFLVWPETATSWIYLLAMVSFGTAAHFLMNYAGRLAPAGMASILRSSSILWGYAFEIIIFGEIPEWSSFVGAFLICTSLAVVTLQHYNNITEKENEYVKLKPCYKNIQMSHRHRTEA